MRTPERLLMFAALAALCACHRTPATPSADVATISVTGGPQQAPGLWSQTVSDRYGARTLRYCLDAASAGAMAAFSRQLGARCSRHDMAKAADGSWHFATSCDMGAAGKVTTEGVMRGDFHDHYFVEADSQTAGAADRRANGPGRMLADIQRLGDCPKEMKAGDVVTQDGGRSRLETLAGHA
jgi:Protein of unknown function (DUF3617)